MRETFVVMRRELVSYFVSPIAYVFGALMLGVLLYYSTEVTLVQGARASLDGHVAYRHALVHRQCTYG